MNKINAICLLFYKLLSKAIFKLQRKNFGMKNVKTSQTLLYLPLQHTREAEFKKWYSDSASNSSYGEWEGSSQSLKT